jgi:hypothetical protein
MARPIHLFIGISAVVIASGFWEIAYSRKDEVYQASFGLRGDKRQRPRGLNNHTERRYFVLSMVPDFRYAVKIFNRTVNDLQNCLSECIIRNGSKSSGFS